MQKLFEKLKNHEGSNVSIGGNYLNFTIDSGPSSKEYPFIKFVGTEYFIIETPSDKTETYVLLRNVTALKFPI